MSRLGKTIETQKRLSLCPNYNRWIYQQIKSYLGKRALEIGCAIGNMTFFFLDRELLVSIDKEAECVEIVRKKFSDYGNFKALQYDISVQEITELKRYNFDTILCLNVLGNIKNDIQVLRNIHKILTFGGTLIILVPALKRLYGTLDKSENLYRRYERKELILMAEKCGFTINKIFFMNLLGAMGWYLNSRLLKRTSFSIGQLFFYDRLVPILSLAEKFLYPPFGLSLIMVGSKIRPRETI